MGLFTENACEQTVVDLTDLQDGTFILGIFVNINILSFAVLESWLDYTGELEPPEPLARLPQLKHCIKQLLTDLGKVQQIALCCST